MTAESRVYVFDSAQLNAFEHLQRSPRRRGHQRTRARVDSNRRTRW